MRLDRRGNPPRRIPGQRDQSRNEVPDPDFFQDIGRSRVLTRGSTLSRPAIAPIFADLMTVRIGDRALRALLIRLAVAIGSGVALSEPQPALPQGAVRTDDLTSGLALAERTRIAILTAALPDAPDMRDRVTRQVLRAMINERLQ